MCSKPISMDYLLTSNENVVEKSPVRTFFYKASRISLSFNLEMVILDLFNQ